MAIGFAVNLSTLTITNHFFAEITPQVIMDAVLFFCGITRVFQPNSDVAIISSKIPFLFVTKNNLSPFFFPQITCFHANWNLFSLFDALTDLRCFTHLLQNWFLFKTLRTVCVEMQTSTALVSFEADSIGFLWLF